MRILFLGSIFPSFFEQQIIKNSYKGVDNASNNFQWSLIEGLDYFFPELKIISVLPIRTFPFNYKKLFIKPYKYQHKSGIANDNLGFINILFFKHLTVYLNFKKELRKLITKNGEAVIFIYGLNSARLKAVYELKKKNNKVTTCLIVPDLPQYMSNSKNPIYWYMKSIDIKLINRYIQEIDSFVLLSEFMRYKLPIGQKPSIVMEGIYSTKKSYDVSFLKEDKTTLLYSGGLSKSYGILNLLLAFQNIKDLGFRLWICGSGDAEEEIKFAASLDRRITFFGQQDHTKVLELQRRATILINPRTSNGDFTKYSFPSKNIEYLASGTPTIMYKLPAIPSEYFDFCFSPEDESISSLMKCIMDVSCMSKDYLSDFGRRASEFIRQNKTPKIQAEKVFNLVNSL
jgi:glycosyltransferase involved in cell wall biosynthesis